MTEQEWLTTFDPHDLARIARGKVDSHRFRFLAVEWGSRLRGSFETYDLPWYEAFTAWVDQAGPHPRELCRWPEYVSLVHGGQHEWAVHFSDAIRADDPMKAAADAGYGASQVRLAEPPKDFTKTHRGRSARKRNESDVQKQVLRAGSEALRADIIREFCEQFRDVAGNPFRPVTFDPSWRSSTALALARSMYSSRDFTTAPILADALQDSGCDDPRILEHLRGENIHVRGCWVVDAVLGKE